MMNLARHFCVCRGLAVRPPRLFSFFGSLSTSTSNAESYGNLRLSQLEEVERKQERSFFTPTATHTDNAVQCVSSALKASQGSSVSLLVRVVSKRTVSKRLVFMTVRDVSALPSAEIQIKLQSDSLQSIGALVRRGDILRVRGQRGSGETVVVESCEIEAPMLRPWQEAYDDRHQLHSQRYLDLLGTPGSLDRFVRRSKAIRAIRAHFDNNLNAIEVETPTLAALAGGAAAVPFETRAHALDQKLFLRIAPELYLKQLIIGGFPRVYEIGKQFRNEGVDRRHNPEFTTLEYYEVDGSLERLMKLTRDIISTLLADVFLHAPGQRVGNIDFDAPYRRISFVDELSRALDVPDVLQLTDAELMTAAVRHANVAANAALLPRAKLFDTLFSALVEPSLEQPTFVLEHPVELSPLARTLPGRPHVAERFEFFAGGMELANAYGELSDPREQTKRFAAQHPDDDEAMPADEQFIEALRYAMPPTAGYGLGIDRLIMLLSQTSSIRDVILFPMLRSDENKQKQK